MPAPQLDSLIDELIRENPQGKRGGLYGVKLEDTVAGETMLGLGPEEQAALVGELLPPLARYDREASAIRAESGDRAPLDERWDAIWTPRQILAIALRGLLAQGLPLEPEHVRGLVRWLAESRLPPVGRFPLEEFAAAVEHFAAYRQVGYELRGLLEDAVDRLQAHEHDPECHKTTDRLIRVLTGGPLVRLVKDEAWSNAALADLAALGPAPRRAWQELLAHCQAVGGKPTGKWLREAAAKVEAVGFDDFKARVLRWFPLLDEPRPGPEEPADPTDPRARSVDDLITPPHVELLRGLAWCCTRRDDRDLARAPRDLALSVYRPIPEKAARPPKLGNPCVAALGLIPNEEAAGALALLKTMVKPIPARREIEKALAAVAARAGAPPGDESGR